MKTTKTPLGKMFSTLVKSFVMAIAVNSSLASCAAIGSSSKVTKAEHLPLVISSNVITVSSQTTTPLVSTGQHLDKMAPEAGQGEAGEAFTSDGSPSSLDDGKVLKTVQVASRPESSASQLPAKNQPRSTSSTAKKTGHNQEAEAETMTSSKAGNVIISQSPDSPNVVDSAPMAARKGNIKANGTDRGTSSTIERVEAANGTVLSDTSRDRKNQRTISSTSDEPDQGKRVDSQNSPQMEAIADIDHMTGQQLDQLYDEDVVPDSAPMALMNESAFYGLFADDSPTKEEDYAGGARGEYLANNGH
ncbi:hypothetical protein HDE_05895 [Halotydeus destructor]|nr:hypothetical protein HDE_05895 [Halotydeus destructor]